MQMFRTPLEKRISQRFKEIDKIVKNSFVLIREDIEELENSVGAMKKYIQGQEKQTHYARKEDNKIRSEFRKDVDDFAEKIRILRMTLEKAKDIEKTVVVKADLARIEDGIRTDFKDVMAELKAEVKEQGKRLKALESGKVRENKKKKSWFSFGE